MTYFNKAQVESALVELETITKDKEKINESNGWSPAPEVCNTPTFAKNGWTATVESKYGLTTYYKEFDSFGLGRDRGGIKSLSEGGHQVCQFFKLSDLEEDNWV
jgi:hypothetical protein